MDARILGEYWLKYVPVDWNEYGVGKRNMRAGLLPPISGEFDNAQWKHSNGAFCRTEIWACLAPGCPALAVRMAREEACVDHGAAEGTMASVFLTALESAAFVEHDRERLIAIGLSMIPADSTLARAACAATEAKKQGKTWAEARQAVIEASEDRQKYASGWFQSPRNIAFIIVGWLYGEEDFAKTLCATVNCGDDTDATGAAIGSILGILHGTKIIPRDWIEPIGKSIEPIAVSGFPTPHPHWVQIKLPKPAWIGRVIIRWADPMGYGVSFEGLVFPAGQKDFQRVFQRTDSKESRTSWFDVGPVETDTFRLVIRVSANPQYPNAAQVGEIELLPGAKE